MAELTIVEDERPGILKEIDDGAMDLIFQAIQQDIYSFPMRSFIREAVSNGLDSIIEREVFRAIQNGEPVEKYFLNRQDGKLLKDSGYNPNYYKEEHLSDNDFIKVIYKEQEPRDLVSVIDYGVGLGGSRLKGYFKLGYSSKRNMKSVIGKFGAGAKAGLATGVEYFVMTTVYNGYKTSFMVYNNDYESITPRTDESFVDVWKVKMANGGEQTREVYWNPTNEKNSVRVDLEVKKHNRQICIDSVVNQFQYFNGRVILEEINEDGYKTTNRLDEKPLYESENLLIPKYSTYNNPHILVDGISYGTISWNELELDTRAGKIAIKVKATDVDITQSRESLKWTQKTKETILGAIERARAEAGDYVARLIKVQDENNLIEINNAHGKLASKNDESVASVFSKFLDMHAIIPNVEFNLGSRKIKGRLTANLFGTIFHYANIRRMSLVSTGANMKTQSSSIFSFSDMRGSVIVYGDEKSLGPKLLDHLLDKFNVNSLIYVRPAFTKEEHAPSYFNYKFTAQELKDYSESFFKKYCNLNIDKYHVNYNEKNEEEEVKIKSDSGIAARLRKANQEVLLTRYKGHLQSFYHQAPEIRVERRKEEVKIKDLEAHILAEYGTKETVIACTGSYRNLGRIVEITEQICPKGIKVLYVAQDVIPHIAPYTTVITDYFRTVNEKTGELMIGEHIRNLNTVRILGDLVKKYPKYGKNYNLLRSFTSIDVTQYSNMLHKLDGYTAREIIDQSLNESDSLLDDIFGYLENLEQFQKVVNTADKDKIADKALELFNSKEIYNIDAYDEDYISTIKEELERLSPVDDVLYLMGGSMDKEQYDSAKPLIEKLLLTLKSD